jgi:cytoskeletal protein RodZ
MSASVGHELRAARQERNLTIEQVSRITFIRPRHLEAIEAGNLAALPSLTQARGFVRTYAQHVGLNPEALVARLGTDGEANGRLETAAPPPPPPPTPVGNLYKDIGFELKQQRETLGLSLDEAENQTRVRRRYLEALEAGGFDQLPSPVQGRGMLKNYADFLGLDPDPLLLKFAEGLQARHAARWNTGGSLSRKAPRPALRRLISGDLLMGSLLILGLIVFVIWGVGRVSRLQAGQSAEATAPSIVDMLDPSETPTATPPTPSPTASIEPGAVVETPAAAETAGPDPLVPADNEDPVQLYIVVSQRTWMRVTVDGEVQFEGRVIPGSAFPFSGRESIALLTGSGSALEVFYNGESLGPLGLFGQIVERIYTEAGVLIPTPEFSPTPTVTPTPEVTPTLTQESVEGN